MVKPVEVQAVGGAVTGAPPAAAQAEFAALAVRLGAETAADLRRAAVGQGVAAPAVQQAAVQNQHVRAVPLAHGRFDLGQLLAGIEDPRFAAFHAQVLLEALVGDRHNAGGAHAAQVDRQAVGRLVADRRPDAFAMVHGKFPC